jgi:chromosome segregation ATPase
MNEHIHSNSSVKPPSQAQAYTKQGQGARIYLMIAGVLFAVMVGFLVHQLYQLHASESNLQAQLTQANKQLSLISQRLNESDSRYADLAAQFEVTTKRLGLTEQELARAHQLAARIRQEQQQRVQSLTKQLEQKAAAADVATLQQQTTSQLGTLSSDISTTREQVVTANKDITETRKELNELQLKLSEYGTLIARNRDELAFLRRKGERDYFEFDIRKGEYRSVGDLRLKLKKADVGKQRFDIEFIADDHKTEKNKININEPIQVFVGGVRTPFEIVVNQVQKDRIIGYVSAPKDRGATPGQSMN